MRTLFLLLTLAAGCGAKNASPHAPTSSVSAGDAAATGAFIGPLALGLPAKDVVTAIREPASKGAGYEEAATGLWLSEWQWPALGVTLVMSGKSPDESISMITVKAPCTFKTQKGIGIGSTRAEVLAAYGTAAHAGEDGSIHLGDEYTPTVFFLESDKVASIVDGGGAE